MNWYIHREKRFDKEIDFLWSRGEKARVAAKRAEEILAKLTEKGWTDLKHVAKLADQGEHRLDGCLKYDIGGGFRLICFKRRDHLYFSFAGSHDDCHRWLNQSKNRPHLVGKREAETWTVEKKKPEGVRIQATPGQEEDYDDRLMEQMDDQLLLKVFSGLVRGLQKKQNIS